MKNKTVQTPEEILEIIKNIESADIIKLMFYIMKHKRELSAVAISEDEFLNGKLNEYGERLDNGLGLPHDRLKAAILDAIWDNFIIEFPLNDKHYYTFNVYEIQPTIIELQSQEIKTGKDDMSQSGFVYIIESTSGLWKIGSSKNPIQRLKQLQTSTGFELTLIKAIEYESYKELEKVLHKQYSNSHVKGEWFNLNILSKMTLLAELNAFESGMYDIDFYEKMYEEMYAKYANQE